MNKHELRLSLMETLLSNLDDKNIINVRKSNFDDNVFECETYHNGFITTFEVKLEVTQYEEFVDEFTKYNYHVSENCFLEIFDEHNHKHFDCTISDTKYELYLHEPQEFEKWLENTFHDILSRIEKGGE